MFQTQTIPKWGLKNGGTYNNWREVRAEIWYSAIPIVVWLLTFKLSSFVPASLKPEINVSILPKTEEFFFGSFVHDWLYRDRTSIFWTFSATIPYFLHFLLPWTYAVWLFLRGKKPGLFLWIVGFINFTAVVTQLCFPTAPPWYYDQYGLKEADYSIKGDPAGLSVADGFLGFPFFKGIYSNSPLVFGAFPSLHAAWPMLLAVCYTYPNRSLFFSIFLWVYTFWVWWAAMYLRHHYFVDILGAVVYVYGVGRIAIKAFEIVEKKVNEHKEALPVWIQSV